MIMKGYKAKPGKGKGPGGSQEKARCKLPSVPLGASHTLCSVPAAAVRGLPGRLRRDSVPGLCGKVTP